MRRFDGFEVVLDAIGMARALGYDPGITGLETDRLTLDLEFSGSFNHVPHRFVITNGIVFDLLAGAFVPETHRDAFTGGEVFLPEFAARRIAGINLSNRGIAHTPNRRQLSEVGDSAARIALARSGRCFSPDGS